MRSKKEDDDGAETPLLEDSDNVVTIFNNSESDSPDTRSARRTRSTTDRIRGRNPSLLGARRTPSNLFKNSNDLDSHNEVRSHAVIAPAAFRTPRWWSPKSHAATQQSWGHYPQLELIVLST